MKSSRFQEWLLSNGMKLVKQRLLVPGSYAVYLMTGTIGQEPIWILRCGRLAEATDAVADVLRADVCETLEENYGLSEFC